MRFYNNESETVQWSLAPLLLDALLVQRLIAMQFPKWSELPIKPVAIGGWDNRTFHLGEHMLVRLPSGEAYAASVMKEQKWLPWLAPQLPFPIPEPLAMGEPGEGYPWNWSVYRWIEGETAASESVINLESFATDLAQFLLQLQSLDTTDGPLPGPHNFSRGGALATYDGEVRQAIDILKEKIDPRLVRELWEMALATQWERPVVWVHGDIGSGNLSRKKIRGRKVQALQVLQDLECLYRER